MNQAQNKPLAERMRPQNLSEFIGQEKLTGESGIIRKMIDSGNIASMIFWGPPGVGKTTLAQIIAEESQLPFFKLSAIESGVKDIRKVIETARLSGKAILFIDEIHQDRCKKEEYQFPHFSSIFLRKDFII